jgi:hypothetical protein
MVANALKALTEPQSRYTLHAQLLDDADSACLFAGFVFWRSISAFSNRLECEALSRD